MSRCALIVLSLLAASAVWAQEEASAPATDEWSPFVGSDAPATEPPRTPPQAPTARERAAPAGAPAVAFPPEPKKEPAIDAEPTVSVRELPLPGAEPHSPATLGRAYSDPSNLRVTAGELGGTGLLHLQSADFGRAGLVHLGVSGEAFSGSGFPVAGANHTRSRGVFAAGYTAFPFLEGYLSFAVTANSNTKSSPRLMQTSGDTVLGVKLAGDLGKGFRAGGDLELQLFPGVGSQSVSSAAFGVAPRLIATWDARERFPKVPLRVHANTGFLFDGTGSFRKSGQLLSSAQEATEAAQDFALGVQRYSRYALSAAVEAPLPFATPFLEYGLAVPLGAKGLQGLDEQAVSVAQAMPQTLGLGARITALKDLSMLLALDFGLASRVAKGISATMPYNFIFGVAYNLDPVSKSEGKLVEKTIEKKVAVARPSADAEKPKLGRVAGTVVDAATHAPLAGALVAMLSARMPPVATDAEAGRYLSYELPAGPLRLTVSKEGYRPATQEAVVEPGRMAALDFALVRELRRATIRVSVTSTKKPVAAGLAFTGPLSQKGQTDAAQGTFSAELPAGKYALSVTADGYLAKTRELEVQEGGAMVVDFELAPVPKKSLVVVKENKIEIRQQVHFATNKAKILGDSFALLDQVIDVIVKGGIKKVKVEGHTDNVGAKEKNLRLSNERAKAVADYLKANGVEAERLSWEGFGDTKPVAPNLTSRGKEMNRRVELFILER